MPAYKTPGVYVEEISMLPPSVAEVSTAIPAFLGYTEKAPASSLARVSTLLEYEQLFGGPKRTTFAVAVSPENVVTSVSRTSTAEYIMYYAISHYFLNGGGPCYVVSVGTYGSGLAKEPFKNGLLALEKEDEPTLIMLTDAVGLATADYHELCQLALAQCSKLMDRFCIFDVKRDADPAAQAGAKKADTDVFRDNIGSKYLSYGAAYFPYLQTSLTCAYADTDVTIGSGAAAKTLESVRTTETALYQAVKKALANERVELPPSGAIAGIYASVDRDRGVWKAPANIGMVGVIGPNTKITHAEQEALNVDPTAGKSINAIRAFTGKGTLVWGARTLAGNDNEWRYVSVRRLFIMIEESARKATDFAVFEPNDKTTWLKVKGMIESFLYGLWQRGALAGSKPESAYFVEVGLGKTMTSQDILEGKMIVKIGVAAVRPAEFIVLQFTHKLQEA